MATLTTIQPYGINTSNAFTFSAVTATGNVSAGNVSAGTGTITGGNIVNSNSNGVGNIGSASIYYNTVFAKATAAQYADLAELYLSDAEYEPGTVVVFGGDQEITLAALDQDCAVAGVISTEPAYQMNSGLVGKYVAKVALAGRVPCRVKGPVWKGAMMVSAPNGFARAERNPAVGTVVGKALQAFDGESGTIEIVVGRM